MNGYTLTIAATNNPPALIMGSGDRFQTFGPAFEVTINGDLTRFQKCGPGSKLDLADETDGQLEGVAVFTETPPTSGEVKIYGTDQPVRDRHGRRLVDGEISVDETRCLIETRRCVWRSALH